MKDERNFYKIKMLNKQNKIIQINLLLKNFIFIIKYKIYKKNTRVLILIKQFWDLSKYFALGLKMNEIISSCLHSNLKDSFCQKCGIYCEKNMGVYGIKNVVLERQNLFSFQIIDCLRQTQFNLSKYTNYFYLSQQVLDAFQRIYHICNQIQTDYHTKILSLYIFLNCHQHYRGISQKDLLLSVLIAIKFQQSYLYLRNRTLIKEIILSPLLKSGQIQQHELIYEEMVKIQKLNFKLKIVTFVDFLEFYVNSGVMFTNQGKKNTDYNKIINYIDSETQKYIQTGLFFSEPNQENLALKILYEARKKCGGIDEIWNWHIEYITKTKKQYVDQLVKEKQNFICLKQTNVQNKIQMVHKSLPKNEKVQKPAKRYRILGQNLSIR